MNSGRGRNPLGKIFLWPIVISILSVVGLVCALVGDGVWDVVSWASLAVPVVLYGYYVVRKRAS